MRLSVAMATRDEKVSVGLKKGKGADIMRQIIVDGGAMGQSPIS